MEIYEVKISPSSLESYDSRRMAWLTDFLIEAEYYRVGRKGGSVTLSATEFPAEFDESKGKKDTLKEVLNAISGVFPSTIDAINGNPPCPGIVLVSQDADRFFYLFTDVAGAISFLNSSFNPLSESIDIPIFISETIRDIGLYEEYDLGDGYVPTGTEETSSSPGEDAKKYVESQLWTLTRMKTGYDDEGNEVPCWNKEIGKYELPYTIGAPCNVTYNDGVFYYNALVGIKYFNEDGEEISSAENKIYYDGDIPDEGIIEFTYVVGNMMAGDEDESDREPGITYRERLKYTVSYIDGNGIIEIGESITYPENYDAGIGLRDYAEVVDGIVTDAEKLSYNPYVKREAFMHIHDYSIDTDDVYIERGIAAAYEAFNVLGEVNTMEDIERYRDDWFRIKGKRD